MADEGLLSQEEIEALLKQVEEQGVDGLEAGGDQASPEPKQAAKEVLPEPEVTPEPAEHPRSSVLPCEEPSPGGNGHGEGLLTRLLDLPVTLTVTVAQTELPVGEVLGFLPGRVVEMDGGVRAPAEVFIDGHLLAKGEIVVVGDRYGVHIKEVVSPRQRLQRLAR